MSYCQVLLPSHPAGILLRCCKVAKKPGRSSLGYFAHFSRSAKRQDAYKEFQFFFQVEPNNILPPAQTRLLSLQACVNHILEHYDVLKLYFFARSN